MRNWFPRSNETRGRLQQLCLFVLIASLLLPLGTAARPLGQLPVQSYLLQLAAEAPDEVVAVVVQKQHIDDRAEQLVLASGGRITQQLPLINAFAATLAAKAIPPLAQSPAVRWVALEAPVVSQQSNLPGALVIQDDFAAVTYAGSDGTAIWQGDWREMGEADGADQGDVAVTPFWGGA